MKSLAVALFLALAACAPSNLAVKVNVEIPNVGSASGSAFAVEDSFGDVHLVTAGHVCEMALAGAVDVSLTFVVDGRGVATGGRYKVAKVSPVDDLCELEEVLPAPHALRALKLADRDPLPGAPVYVAGAPYGIYPVFTRAQHVGRELIGGHVYTVGAGMTGPGNSGSPIMDADGRVVGLLVRGFQFIFAGEPAENIRAFVEQ